MTFRTRVFALTLISAIAFLILTVANTLSANKVEAQLSAIQNQLVPRVELELQLDAQFERINRGFQDAVGAKDVDALEAVRADKEKFASLLSSPGVDPNRATELHNAIDDYFTAALDVSRRLIHAETGEDITVAISAMQAKRIQTTELIRKSAALDRNELPIAFRTTHDAMATAHVVSLSVAVVCFVLVLMLSIVMARGLLRSLASLTAGLERFGEGKFEPLIPIETQDELGEIAQHANTMARNLERLDEERRAALNELQISNKELEAFSYSVAHNLRSPLRGINGFSSALLEDYGDKLQGDAKDYIDRICAATDRMSLLIDSLLALSRVARAQLQRKTVSLTEIADDVAAQLRTLHPDRSVLFANMKDVSASCDPTLIRAALENLIGNAWKFTAKNEKPEVAFGVEEIDDEIVYFVRDNGAGFDMAYAEKLFAPFQRLHDASQFAGTGVGLATVQRIVQRHGGRIWADSKLGEGTTFRFTLGGA